MATEISAEIVRKCSFSFWYEDFKKFTFKSRILKIPPDVLAYISADGIVLPESSHGINSRAGTEWDSDDEDLKEDWGDENIHSTQAPSFPEFDQQIKDAITALGGSVFPKLNWSSPKDAAWIALNNSMECKTPADIYLLLKSSTFVTHDLTNPFHIQASESSAANLGVQYELVLRRYHNLNSAGEFRCFVKNKSIIGISQRHYRNYFVHIKLEKTDIVEDIEYFFREVIRDTFPEVNYVVDVYRKEKGKVYVVDFNPFCSVTDGLMFSWQELDNLASTDATSLPKFRFVEQDTGITSNPYQTCAIPQDFVDLTTGMDANKLVDLLQMKIQSQQDESSSDEEGEKQQGSLKNSGVSTTRDDMDFPT